ncbi:fumarylacetoacetate hydrolase family protein [Aliihoeflea sp. 40Bstr573]|uniref:fumarylacetoacetate hydrolase family protein n=1 Tax=Aliihoeflea sp. 40Bstr573 TaxID=2696467 RepID=UPI00209558B7|nr:fumarylacetoacetate hydrolase family protein [Aliihoeflea sp. 40Bstr573]MCO6388760.1 FAA hydrolase family protein [Aliihoeflea sp. 40Bstr573]
MKLLRYGDVGSEKPAILDNDGIVRDLSGVVPDIGGIHLDDATIERIRMTDLTRLPELPRGGRIGACVSTPTNFIAVGLNYADHAEESGMAIPAEPILFSKAPNCIVGPNDDVVAPAGSAKLDWEIELALVIGKKAHNVQNSDAMSHVAGFCICNDISERAWQIEGTGQWLKGKSAPTFGPLGPWLVTRDEIGDVGNLPMELKVDGKTMQSGSTKTMIFDVPYLVSYISKFIELIPGDVITTGTPPGVGMGKKPPVYLKSGATMESSIVGLGTQRQIVRAAGNTGTG